MSESAEQSRVSRITLRVLDGADRGRTYDTLVTPVTIGREEGNSVQLNDERVSRFHLKIQEDHDKLVLTDLESTNGTKVNGEDVQLRILRFGDMISVGHSVLLFGSEDQIASRLKKLRNLPAKPEATIDGEGSKVAPRAASLDFDVKLSQDPDLQATLHMLEPPDLPARLTAGQSAQLAELLEYFHIRMRQLLGSVRMEQKIERVNLDLHQWQSLIDLQSRIAGYLRMIGNPE